MSIGKPKTKQGRIPQAASNPRIRPRAQRRTQTPPRDCLRGTTNPTARYKEVAVYSPFVITVSRGNEVVETVQVSDSHELEDQLAWLREDYPNYALSYETLTMRVPNGSQRYPFRKPSGERPTQPPVTKE